MCWPFILNQTMSRDFLILLQVVYSAG